MSRANHPDDEVDDDVGAGGDAIAAEPQEVLAFDEAVVEASTSWTRADPDAALIERWGRYGYLVTLPGGDAHFCAIGRRGEGDDREHIGWCRCKGFRYHDGPCAHLCTVRKADWANRHLDADHVDVTGEPLRIERAVKAEPFVQEEHAAAQRDGEVMEATDARDQAAADESADSGQHGRLHRLTPSEREVYLAVEVRGLQPHEAAAETSRSARCARTLLYRARGKLGEEAD